MPGTCTTQRGLTLVLAPMTLRLGFAIFLTILLASCVRCRDETERTVRSPNGKYDLVVQNCGCDATTGFKESGYLVPAADPVSCQLPQQQRIFYANSSDNVAVQWRSDSELLVLSDGYIAHSQSSPIRAVSLVFSRRDGR